MGPNSNENLCKETMILAIEYMKGHIDGRPKNSSAVYRVRAVSSFFFIIFFLDFFY